MENIEEKKEYSKTVIRTCYLTNVLYLLLHVFYFVVFLVAKMYVIFYINLASILIYSLTFIILKKEKYLPYALICGNEFVIFASVATILCGFGACFHLSIIAMCVVCFYAVYFNNKETGMKNAVVWTVYSCVVFFVIFFVTFFNEPMYELANWTYFLLFSVHTITIFLFIGGYLRTFTSYAFKLEKRIIKESRIDKLTQIHNRYDLHYYFSDLKNKNDYSLAIFDLDDFKIVNDKYGHLCGDFILKELARLATLELSDSFVSRYGGEEFIIISKTNGDYNKTIEKLDNFRKLIENNEFVFGKFKLHITLTIGAVSYNNEETLEDWIRGADKNLYKGKKNGKNQVVS